MTALEPSALQQLALRLSGQLKRIMSVIKLRGSAHAKEFRLYDITDDGIVIGDVLKNYEGLLKGSPLAIVQKPERATRDTRRKTR